MIRELFGGGTLVIGHRGAPGSFGIPPSRRVRAAATEEEAERYGPENTLVSFERALALGADLVECDVHLSRDGEVVVIHDDTVDRTTDATGAVADLSLAELKRLDAGGWFGSASAGARIPTLAEALEWAQGRVPLVIELKVGPHTPPELGRRVAEVVADYDATRQVVVISFSHPFVARLKDLEPSLMTGVLFACRPVDAVALAAAARAEVLMPHWSYVVAQDVAAAHEAGLIVAPWVSSDPVVLGWLTSAGVDAIGSNHPDALRALLSPHF